MAEDGYGQELKVGDKVFALHEIPYLMGQIPSDCIQEGELLTIDQIDGDDIYFLEIPDRYKLWESDDFALYEQGICPHCQKKIDHFFRIKATIEHIDSEGISSPTDHYPPIKPDDYMKFNDRLICPSCGGVIRLTDDEIKGFLKGK